MVMNHYKLKNNLTLCTCLYVKNDNKNTYNYYLINTTLCDQQINKS